MALPVAVITGAAGGIGLELAKRLQGSGMVGRLLDLEFGRIAVEVDRLTAQKVAARGGFAAGFNQSARITRRDAAD